MLSASGWRRLVVWECALKGRGKLPFENLVRLIADWLRGATDALEAREII